MNKILFFSLLLSILTPLTVNAELKTFIREYNYQASDDDSKNSARKKALEQVKLSLLNEVGIYLQSYMEVKNEKSGSGLNKFVDEEIKTITAGITKTKIIDETWDGSTYYLKAKIELDINDVLKKLNLAIEERKSSKELKKLTKLLNEKGSEIEIKNKELSKLTAKVETKNREIEKINSEHSNVNQRLRDKELLIQRLESNLNDLKNKLQTANQEEQAVRSEYEKIRREINSKTSQAASKNLIGMTRKEVVLIIGQPRSKESCAGGAYNYGNLWVKFESGIVACIVDRKRFQACRTCAGYDLRR